jgi:CBS domain-containing protein
VEEVMTRKLITCRPDDDVESAMKAMAQYQLRRIPVVDDNNRLVGIISQADVATRVGEPEKTAEVVKEISES